MMARPPAGLRYATPTGPSGEFQPGSRGRVLKNLLGITQKNAMDRAEFEALVLAQEHYLHRIGPDTRLTSDLLGQLHRAWLGGIYVWAGQYRTVELQKGSFRWPPAYLVERNMAALEEGVLQRLTPCPPGPLTEVARCLAEVHAELLLVHPVRDGNGRLARWVADLMAMQAGFPAPEYRFTGPGRAKIRDRYLVAVTRGYAQDYGFLADFFAEAIARRLERRA